MSGPVLALDTATAATAAAVMIDGQAFEAREDAVPGSMPLHSPALLRLADDALERAGIGIGDVSTVAVGIGPGSFTGLRVGISAAVGIAAGLGVEAVGVGSLRALIAGAAGTDRPVLGLIDARRGELFASLRDGGAGSGAPVTVPLDEVAGLAAEGTLCVGDGALIAREALEGVGAEVPPAGDPRHSVLASTIARLASAPDCSGSDLLPLYVRSPDAVPRADR